MKSIKINYRPISWIPVYRTVSANFPQNWGEICVDQLLAIVSLSSGKISELKFLSKFSGMKTHNLKRFDDYQIFKLSELLEFINDRNPHHEFIIRKLSIRHNQTLYAPNPKLKGVTFGQFIFTDSYFSNFQESRNEVDLNKFIASLYLGKNEKFEERLIQERFECIGMLNKSIRQAIVLNYQLIHEWLTLAYPLIFQKQEEKASSGAEQIETNGSNRDPNQWIKIFQNFVGDDILHDDEWASKPVNTIFAYMTRKYKENARTRNK
ncbi:MAG: hypothetical protein JZU47_09965 [Prolixibacteraceae bacterium]|nr:hypothetical protein [Prolixibacteraceae bacterium]